MLVIGLSGFVPVAMVSELAVLLHFTVDVFLSLTKFRLAMVWIKPLHY